MKITQVLSDPAILKELGARLTRYRLNADRSQAVLAEEAGVSKRTVERVEAGESVQFANLVRVLRALSLAGRIDHLVPSAPSSPIERLKLEGKPRQRASGSRKASSDKNWTWADA